MGTGVFVIIGFLFVLTLVGTFLIGKTENDKIKKREGETAKDELQRSWNYESSSLKTNIPSLLIIYVIFIVGGIVALAIYIF
ncbi:hypothetical protein [Aquisalibacillus elongatus]|uniref:Uncharacterized protein n=1 Tax=Aquisalibacillus elongatus TaxID=485577 RepID=A0A3N5B019_9BACI|nr:hypothetical protein [Aquisalibacillus elongatus]RPF50607.1 hypothetical protein EDC24_2575 [Aquisalibacillus elongatus]